MLLFRLLLFLLFLFLLGGFLLFLGGGLLFLFRRALFRFRFGLRLRLRCLGLRRRGGLLRLLGPRSGSGFLRFRRFLLLDLRFNQFVADENVLALDRERLLFRFVNLRRSDRFISTERRSLVVDDDDVLRRLEFLREERAQRVPRRRRLRLVRRLERDLDPLQERVLLSLQASDPPELSRTSDEDRAGPP